MANRTCRRIATSNHPHPGPLPEGERDHSRNQAVYSAGSLWHTRPISDVIWLFATPLAPLLPPPQMLNPLPEQDGRLRLSKASFSPGVFRYPLPTKHALYFLRADHCSKVTIRHRNDSSAMGEDVLPRRPKTHSSAAGPSRRRWPSTI